MDGDRPQRVRSVDVHVRLTLPSWVILEMEQHSAEHGRGVEAALHLGHGRAGPLLRAAVARLLRPTEPLPVLTVGPDPSRLP